VRFLPPAGAAAEVEIFPRAALEVPPAATANPRQLSHVSAVTQVTPADGLEWWVMGEGQHNVLLIGGESPLVRAAVPLLRRNEFEVHRAPPDAGVVDVVTDMPFDLVIVEVEALPIPLQQVVGAVRDPESPCRTAGLIVIAEEAIRPAVPELLQTGVNRVVFRSAPAGDLLHAVADLLSVAPVTSSGLSSSSRPGLAASRTVRSPRSPTSRAPGCWSEAATTCQSAPKSSLSSCSRVSRSRSADAPK